MSVASDFKLESQVKELSKYTNAFGVNLGQQVEDFLEKTEDKVAEFAVELEDKMVKSAPIWSGNLRESIDINEDEYPLKTFVGTDKTKITARAGQEVGEDKSGLGRPDKGYKYPNYDYTDEVNDLPSTTSNEGAGGEFLNSTWLEHAKVLSNQKFGSSKGVRLVKN